MDGRTKGANKVKDKVNWVVLIWGYFCLAVFIYALLFGSVSLG